jgi:hypothetical protein
VGNKRKYKGAKIDAHTCDQIRKCLDESVGAHDKFGCLSLSFSFVKTILA